MAFFQQMGVITSKNVAAMRNGLHCETKEYIPYTTGALIMIVVCCTFVLLASMLYNIIIMTCMTPTRRIELHLYQQSDDN